MKVNETAASHCELDPEFHVRQTGQIYKSSHFSARELCNSVNYLKNSNICASEGIIGPISDILHLQIKKILDDLQDDDWYDEDEDDDEEDDDWEDDDDWEYDQLV